MLKKSFLVICLLMHFGVRPMGAACYSGMKKRVLSMLSKKIIPSNLVSPSPLDEGLLKQSQLNQDLLVAVENHALQDVLSLLSQGANPNSFQGDSGILSKAVYGVNVSVSGSGDKKHIDESLEILDALVCARVNLVQAGGYNCHEHVEMIASCQSGRNANYYRTIYGQIIGSYSGVVSDKKL